MVNLGIVHSEIIHDQFRNSSQQDNVRSIYILAHSEIIQGQFTYSAQQGSVRSI